MLCVQLIRVLVNFFIDFMFKSVVLFNLYKNGCLVIHLLQQKNEFKKNSDDENNSS